MNYAPFDRMDPRWSAVVTDGLLGALLALWVLGLVTAAITQYLKGRKALADVTEHLRPGVTTLGGTVALEPGAEGAPVTVTIHQQGEQHASRNEKYVVWSEVRRDTRARPFYVALRDGRRVRVEPVTDALHYADDLEAPERAPLANTRTRRASLDPGERVFVRGELVRALDPHGKHGGYRDGGAPALVMRPAPEGMLVSSRPVHEDFNRRAGLHLLYALLGVGVLVGAQSYAFRDYRALRRRGEAVQAVVTSRSQYTTRHRNRVVTHYVLEAQLPDGTPLRDEVSEGAWYVSQGRATMPFTVARRGRAVAQIGVGEVGASRSAAVILTILAGALVIFHAASARAARPWYARRTVADRESGTL